MRYWSLHEISDQFFRRKTLEVYLAHLHLVEPAEKKHLLALDLQGICSMWKYEDWVTLHHGGKYYHLTILIGMFLNYLVLLHLGHFQLLDVRQGPQWDANTMRFTYLHSGYSQLVSKNIGSFLCYTRGILVHLFLLHHWSQTFVYTFGNSQIELFV